LPEKFGSRCSFLDLPGFTLTFRLMFCWAIKFLLHGIYFGSAVEQRPIARIQCHLRQDWSFLSPFPRLVKWPQCTRARKVSFARIHGAFSGSWPNSSTPLKQCQRSVPL